MTFQFTPRSGIRVSRTATPVPFDEGIRTLIDRLDTEPGALFSSGFEYPDRYSRWEMGFAAPPLHAGSPLTWLQLRAANGWQVDL